MIYLFYFFIVNIYTYIYDSSKKINIINSYQFNSI